MNMTEAVSKGFARPTNAGDQYLALGSLVTIIVPSTATGGRFAVIEHVIPPSSGPPLHTHTGYEYLHIIEGTFDTWIHDPDTPIPSAPGSTILVPPGVPHTTRNVGARAGRMLSIYAPGGDEDFFRAAGTPLAELPAPPDLHGPPDLSRLHLDRIEALAAQFGMRLVGRATPS